VAFGFIVVPGDSGAWWLQGLFFADGRTGFVGWGGNQSLRGIPTRLAGSINGAATAWVIAALVVAVVGLASAVLLDRAGHAMLAILATALVGLLDSPISWDHHWVWVVPGIMAAVYWCSALTGLMLLVYFPWPGRGGPADPARGRRVQDAARRGRPARLTGRAPASISPADFSVSSAPKASASIVTRRGRSSSGR
jgi:hypothetical protein